MQQLKDIKEKILSVIGKGEILLIVPPFGSIYELALGPHILQSLARENGYQTDILYLNLVLASLIGIERYEEINDAPIFWMLGERLFTRSAYHLPPLGKNSSDIADEAAATMGNIKVTGIFYETQQPFDLDVFLRIEEICKSFIDEITAFISTLDYKIIGCSVMMEQINCSITLLNGIKKHAPETITIIGGGNCKGEMAEGTASLSTAIDYTFSGESEISFLNFLKDYSSQKLSPPHTIIPGEPLSNLDTLPLADYTIFFKQYDRFLGDKNQEKIRVWYETGRGCWWAEKSKCTFCSEHPVFFRQKSINKVVHDIKKIKKSISNKTLYMADNIMPRSFQQELLPVLGNKEVFPSLGYLLRANLDLKDLVNLRNANVKVVLPGIETFSTKLLKLMNKGISGRQNLLFLRNAACVGISASWFLLWGFPGDTLVDYEEILSILPLIRHLQPPMRFRPIGLMRFSPYFDNQKEYKISNVQPWPVFDMIYPHWAHLEKLAIYYSGDYPCQSRRNPEIIREISQQVTIWKKTWKNSSLAMGRFMDAFAIYDNRDIHKKAKTHVVDYFQAKEIMTDHIYNESGNLKWAVEEKLGVVVDSWYVPLVTAPPELLLEFESHSEGSSKGTDNFPV